MNSVFFTFDTNISYDNYVTNTQLSHILNISEGPDWWIEEYSGRSKSYDILDIFQLSRHSQATSPCILTVDPVIHIANRRHTDWVGNNLLHTCKTDYRIIKQDQVFKWDTINLYNRIQLVPEMAIEISGCNYDICLKHIWDILQEWVKLPIDVESSDNIYRRVISCMHLYLL